MKQLLSFLMILGVLGVADARAEAWIPVESYASNTTETAPTHVPNTYFQITMKEVEEAVSKAMVEESVAEHVEINILPSGVPVLYKANHPIQLVIRALQIDPGAMRWQAQANIVADGKTESVKPISGRYDEMISVPMLTRQIGSKDVIEMTDLDLRLVPKRKLRKDTVTDVDLLIGKSARRMISAHRMIRSVEVVTPMVVEKGNQVEMVYNTPYMSIRTTGIALENGTQNSLIRVKNNDTERAVSAKVVDAYRVEVTPTTLIN